MIYAVRKHAHRANHIYQGSRPAIYPRQLRKLYTDADLRRDKKKMEFKVLRKNEQGYFSFQKVESKAKPKSRSNYFSYSNRASKILGETKLADQLGRHRSVFHAAMSKHLKKDS